MNISQMLKVHFMLKRISPESVNNDAIICFSSNSSLRKYMDNNEVIAGLEDIMTAREPVEFDDFSNNPNATEPQM